MPSRRCTSKDTSGKCSVGVTIYKNNFSSRHILVLDGIRAYAVLMVCIVISFRLMKVAYMRQTDFWVLFFLKFLNLVSGALNFSLFCRVCNNWNFARSKKSTEYFTTFYARRFLRIFPLYYFVLFVSFVILPKLYTVDPAGVEVIDKQAWLWTYTHNFSWLWGKGGWDASFNFPSFGHFWSLCVEEHFYLLWPLWIYISSEKWLPRVMWSIVCFLLFLFCLFIFSLTRFLYLNGRQSAVRAYLVLGD